MSSNQVAVLIPCFNEEKTVYAVITAFKAAIPDAVIYVGDNGSSDHTRHEAIRAGATVITEPQKGKGAMVRRMFAEIDADCYVMVDGDGTYSAGDAPKLLEKFVRGKSDMVIAVRLENETRAESAYRAGHRFGNAMLSMIFSKLMRLELRDSLSGYRVMSRRFVKTFVGSSIGFELETDLNAHAAIVGCAVSEAETIYKERPNGSVSKLRTFVDGWRILRRNFQLFQQVRPLLAFASLSLPWLIGSILMFVSFQVSYTYDEVVKVPSIVASTGLGLVALNLFSAGVIVKRISLQRSEQIRLAFLRF